MSDNLDNFLAHYGVKGMKWGVTRGVVNPRMQRTSKENKVRTKRKDARRRRQVLSDKDLDSLVNRLQKEKKLKELLDEDLSPGRTTAKKLLLTGGGVVLGGIITGGLKYGLRAALTKDFNLVEAANEMLPKPKKK